ncbi:hypothetical protein CONLIGDRAFT_181074 [Coniochaeta ligniaria NRRL 30616]|uniref:Vacuolar ATPase assembly protein VMA22 n=1 Tax=Coniochaeta ligniaria NRRL 30616 TaxID=1408157 RepID=A0A1J7J214_9PEZI|nr:hypothetical protein CONLIGDRAFT_181074 [Coniochaeta ligniaria NRRL 30616]
MAASPGTPADAIDGLLERYLGLVDEYARLRSTLSALQAHVYQAIARANFSAERGIRYGQELYDERMQASRSLAITPGEHDTPKFGVVYHGDKLHGSQGDEKHEAASEAEKEDENQADDEKAKVEKPSDPLKWFGILTPMTLRLAQGKAIEAVEQVIPRLVTLDAEMADVEIRVRRARKKRSKAEAAALKQQQALDSEKAAVEDEAAVDSDKDPETADEKQLASDIEREARTEDEALASKLESTSIS